MHPEKKLQFWFKRVSWVVVLLENPRRLRFLLSKVPLYCPIHDIPRSKGRGESTVNMNTALPRSENCFPKIADETDDEGLDLFGFQKPGYCLLHPTGVPRS